MDIANLQAFSAVAETGSFSTAAQQLFVTQPAVSKRISGLETELGVALFDRIGRQVNLTEAGRALLPRASRILEEVVDSRRALSNLSGEVSGLLSVGTSHHIGLHRLPPVLRKYTAAWPTVHLDLHFMDSEAACQAVLHGDFELGIVTLPLQATADLQQKRVWSDPLDVVLAAGHPLAHRSSLSIEELATMPAILPAKGTFTRELVEQAFAPLEVPLQVSMSTNYLETIRMLVSIGLGWSVLPTSMTDDEVRPVKVAGIDMQRQLGVVWHARRTLSNAATAMLDQLIAHGNQKTVPTA